MIRLKRKRQKFKNNTMSELLAHEKEKRNFMSNKSISIKLSDSEGLYVDDPNHVNFSGEILRITSDEGKFNFRFFRASEESQNKGWTLNYEMLRNIKKIYDAKFGEDEDMASMEKIENILLVLEIYMNQESEAE